MYAGHLNQIAAGIQNSNAKFIRDKSGLMLAEVYSITFKISRFNPLEGSGYQELPKFLANKKGIINVQNNDQRCFGYSVLAALLPNQKAHRQAHYSDADFAKHGLDAIEYPVSPTDLPRIEQQLNISINVIGFYDGDGKARYPLYCSRHVSETEIDLLYLDGHFAWIKDFSRLMNDITKHDYRYFWCKRCFGHFKEEETLARDKQLCTRENFISNVHILPESASSIKFTNWKYITMAPFVIYADLESVLADVDISHGKTRLYQKHKCCAASAIIRSEKVAEMDGTFCLFTGENALKQLLDQLIEWETKCIQFLETNRAMKDLTEAQRPRNLEANECCICHRADRPFDPEHADWRKVHDHDHVTGYYIGALHDLCNRQHKVVYNVPVFSTICVVTTAI